MKSRTEGLPLPERPATSREILTARFAPSPSTRAGNFGARRYRVHPALADLIAGLAGLGAEAAAHDLLLQIESRGH